MTSDMGDPAAQAVRNGDELIRRYKAIRYLAAAMNAADTEEDLDALLVDQCRQLVGADFGALLVPAAEPGQLRIARLAGPAAAACSDGGDPAGAPSAAAVAGLRIRPGEGISGRVYQEGLAQVIPDAELDPTYHPIVPGMRSELALPVGHAGTVLAVLRLESGTPEKFHEADAELLLTVTAHAGQLLQRFRLKAELEERIKLKDILIEVSRSVANHFDIADVFKTVMRQLADRFGILRGMLVLFEPSDPSALSVHAAYNLTEEEMSRGIYKAGEGIIGRVVQEGEGIAIPDIFKEKTFLNRMQIKRKKDSAVSFIAVPFKVEGQVAGVIAVEKEFDSAETLREEKDMMTLVASLIAIKIRVYNRVSGERDRLMAENSSLKHELSKRERSDEVICKNRKMIEILELVELVADSTSSVMVLGESGTGKEVIARAIHRASGRRDAPFVSVNCAAIPENLLESELFGYKKGAFTGAVQDKKGKFQLANGGTLFLDEIGDMTTSLQVKLLRAIQDREVEPVGAERKEKVDIRIIAATNRDLRKLIAEHLFREDLYYRLNVVEIKLPPLRERPDDIPFLVNHFIRKFAKESGRRIDGIDTLALRTLQGHSWPGNVRELENVIERAVLLCRTGSLELSHLPPFIAQSPDEAVDGQFISRWVANHVKFSSGDGRTWDEVIGAVEKELIQQSLLANGRNKLRTAAFLGINRNTLRAKIDLYGLE
jgi:Nif-specific regulatory protein